MACNSSPMRPGLRVMASLALLTPLLAVSSMAWSQSSPAGGDRGGGSLVISNGAVVTIEGSSNANANSSVSVQGNIIVNGGTLLIHGGSVNIGKGGPTSSNSHVNDDGAQNMAGNKGGINIGGNLRNSGRINTTNNGKLNVGGNVTNNGVITNSNGGATSVNGSVDNNGAIHNDNGTLKVCGNITGNGTITGNDLVGCNGASRSKQGQ